MINPGYAKMDEENGLMEGPHTESFDKYRLQLIHHLVMEMGEMTPNKMNGKSVLETGCGRGGGLSYIVS